MPKQKRPALLNPLPAGRRDGLGHEHGAIEAGGIGGGIGPEVGGVGQLEGGVGLPIGGGAQSMADWIW